MNLQSHFIIINGVDKTYQVESIGLNGNKYTIKFRNTEKVYSYSCDKVTWLSHPVAINCDNCHVYVNRMRMDGFVSIHLFTDGAKKYYAVTFDSGLTKHYNDNEIDIRHSCLTEKGASVFEYLRQCAGINTLGVNDGDESSKGILSSIYSRIEFVDDKTAAAVYLNPAKGIQHNNFNTPIFPFGCNASQERAVKSALANQISVIQGPPGTGKTQTILNIIANLLIEEKSVLIVSNNNSATENVLEKLSKNGLGFLVAPLGNKENKEAFVANQPSINPELPSWHITTMEMNRAETNVKTSLETLESIFEMQERLAICRQELAELKVEKQHFEQEHNLSLNNDDIKIASSKILKLRSRINGYALKSQDDNLNLWNRIKTSIARWDMALRLRFMLKVNSKLTADSIPEILTSLDRSFYNSHLTELTSEINSIEHRLSQLDSTALIKSLTDSSMAILKSALSKRFDKPRDIIASVQDLYNSGERVLKNYPVILSTTFSSKMCFNSDVIFDYVIMDEASQVSVDTGLLALTCARNAVIVGDTMQLPNVVKEEAKIKLNAIRTASSIPDSYNASTHSFLSSVLATIATVPETMLREHYRCHPDIINFCNQKFYGGNLLIMTQRNDDEKHLLAITTAEGKHCRGYYNQREIDTVRLELMPLLDNLDETGIIAPYNSQVNQFQAQIPEIEAATVHKYQGREKETIIMSVTDDIITEFADNSNLLNVAVSRAKNKFCLVVSGNSQELKGNIHDLLGYIRYQQGTVIQSKLRSIYDYLFSKIEANKIVSEFQSENLTFDLIEKIRTSYAQLSHIKALCHYPMRSLIRDMSGLTESETRYATHPMTHIDFLIINRVSKEPLLAIETDGYSFHNEQTEQYQRDRMKDHILETLGLPLLRLSTVGHSEEQQIVEKLMQGISMHR